MNLFDWKQSNESTFITPWKPEPLTHEHWPPNYRAVYAWRMKMLRGFRSDPVALMGAKKYYSTRPGEFIMHWMDTYNPRKVNMKWIPFVFFMKQAEVISFFDDLSNKQESGLIEKCRDAGVTWLGCGYSVWRFLFNKHDSIGWGSRKAMLVDELGNPDSIFEKMRLILRRLPPEFLPNGWNEKKHTSYMKFINPENGASINGEAGDNIGRGGRKSIYFKDEAQPLTAGILTPSGWQTMRDMQVGSRVIGPDGKPRNVIAINDAGEHKIYRVTFSDGTSTECSLNHLWTLNRMLGKRETVTIRASELLETYCYRSPSGQSQYRYAAPITKPVEFDPVEPLPLDPWVVGVLIGDGSIGSGCVSFTSADPETVVRFAERAPEGTRISFGSRYTWRFVDDGNRYNKSSNAKNLVKKAGIYGRLAHEKFIPDVYKFASVNDRIELLRGLMDTDGSASGGVASYHTCSERLANDVRFLVQSLGGTATINVKPDYRGYRDMFALHMTIPGVVPFHLSRKIEVLPARKNLPQKRIISVEHVSFGTVRCITVDHDDGLYLTDHCIVTHNSSHYERPEKIEAALGDNTNVQIDISSVNGLGNPFHRRRMAGVEWSAGKQIEKGFVRVMVIDWRDHPEKDQEWYDQRRAKYEREGMLHLFAQEVDRDYSAAISNTIIPKQYIMAAIDAHVKLGWTPEQVGNRHMAGLDVADGGVDRNGFVIRQGLVCRHAEEWGERDPGVTTRRSLVSLRRFGRCETMYDSIGIGSSVKSEYNRLVEEKVIDPALFPFVPWNAGAAVNDPKYRVIPDDEKSITNEDMFYNLKAQAWWNVRIRFYKTWRAVTEGVKYPVDELISLDSNMPLLYQLIGELAQPVKKESTSKLKMLVDKQPDGTKSPNLGDAFVMCYFPVVKDGGTLVGSYGV